MASLVLLCFVLVAARITTAYADVQKPEVGEAVSKEILLAPLPPPKIRSTTVERMWDTRVFMAVFSYHDHVRKVKRQVIRNTWVHFAKYHLTDIFEYKFILPKEGESMLADEQAEQGDLLFFDAVHNRGRWAHMVLAVLKYYANNQAKDFGYWIKVDDDAWVHPAHMIRALSSLPHRKGVYWGRVCPLDAGMVDIVHNNTQQAAIEFPRPFLHGAVETLSSDMVLALVDKLPALNDPANSHVQKWINFNFWEDRILPQLLDFATGGFMLAPGEVNFDYSMSADEFYDTSETGWDVMLNPEAEAGRYPSQTIVVHQLKPLNDYLTIHEKFSSSLEGWSKCIMCHFGPSSCQTLLEGGHLAPEEVPNIMC